MQKFKEQEIDDALNAINKAIYTIEDNTSCSLCKELYIKSALGDLYRAFQIAKKMLDRDYPNSKLYEKYGLNDEDVID